MGERLFLFLHVAASLVSLAPWITRAVPLLVAPLQLMLLGPAVALFAAPAWAIMSDRGLGRRSVLLVAATSSCLCNLSLLWVSTSSGLYASWIIRASCEASLPVVCAMVSDQEASPVSWGSLFNGIYVTSTAGTVAALLVHLGFILALNTAATTPLLALAVGLDVAALLWWYLRVSETMPEANGRNASCADFLAPRRAFGIAFGSPRLVWASFGWLCHSFGSSRVCLLVVGLGSRGAAWPFGTSLLWFLLAEHCALMCGVAFASPFLLTRPWVLALGERVQLCAMMGMAGCGLLCCAALWHDQTGPITAVVLFSVGTASSPFFRGVIARQVRLASQGHLQGAQQGIAALSDVLACLVCIWSVDAGSLSQLVYCQAGTLVFLVGLSFVVVCLMADCMCPAVSQLAAMFCVSQSGLYPDQDQTHMDAPEVPYEAVAATDEVVAMTGDALSDDVVLTDTAGVDGAAVDDRRDSASDAGTLARDG